MKERIAYLNGEMMPFREAGVSIVDSAVVLGCTVTEMTRTFNQKPFRLKDHMERLYRSLRYVRIDPGVDLEGMERLSMQVLEANLPMLEADEDSGLIHFITGGQIAAYADIDPGDVRPTVCIHTIPLKTESWARFYEEGAHVVTPSIRHVPPQCIDPKMKYRSRMHFYLAEQEVKHADSEAFTLLLDIDGNVTEASGANFLIAKDDAIYSPTTRNILPGVSRATVFDLADGMGITCIEKDLQVHDVCNADEAFLASTPYCVLPVVKINGIPIKDGKPGPLVARLLEEWGKMVGVDIVAQAGVPALQAR